MNQFSRSRRWRAALLLSLLYVLTVLASPIGHAVAGPSTSGHHHSMVIAQHIDLDALASFSNSEHEHQHEERVPAAADLQCCALACISAVPAMIASLDAPAVVLQILRGTEAREEPKRQPPQRYRPPIV